MLLAVLVCLYFVWADRSKLNRHVTVQQEQNEALAAEVGELKTEKAVLCEQRQTAEKQIQDARNQFLEAQRQARETFQAVAGEVLEKSGERLSKQFIQLASERFKTEQAHANKELELRKKEVESLVKPIGQSLDKYNHSIQQIEKVRHEAYGSIKEQIVTMSQDQRRLRDETANLVKALRRPEVRGRWGEMQLKRVAELAGMIERCDFSEQLSVSNRTGIQRPDMVVHLPSGRTIVVDAKTPLEAYLNAIESVEDESQRRDYYQKHARQIETQVKALADKKYTAQFSSTPDFVVLFIPGESFLQAAVQVRPSLIEEAMERGVIISSPSTLVALLKAVALGWQEQRIAENARQISELGKELHERLNIAFEHMTGLGKSLETTVTKYNKLAGSLQTKVLPQTRRFEEMGAGSRKQLPTQIKEIDQRPREIRIMEAGKQNRIPSVRGGKTDQG